MMQVRLLPAPFINKKFIVGEAKCNYELYLLELINRSAWFSDRFPGGFFSPDSEANGEYDANNEYYQIDFNLFVAESSLRAQNLLSPQIIIFFENCGRIIPEKDLPSATGLGTERLEDLFSGFPIIYTRHTYLTLSEPKGPSSPYFHCL